MSDAIAFLKDVRILTAKVVADFSPEQRVKVPQDFKNNIIWNVGHMIVTQQMLSYGLAGLDLKVDSSMVPLFKKGSAPENWQETPDWDDLVSQLSRTVDTFEADYKAGLFENFKEYTVSTTGTTLKTIDDAIAFNNFHEGLHIGTILALRKLVK